MENNKTLVVSNSGAPMTVPGAETLDRSDLVIPRLRLVQAQSAFSDAVGQLYNSLTGEAKPRARVVILRVGKARVMWPTEFQRDQDPICASDDGAVPREVYRGVYAQRCEGCVQAQWLDDTPPPCALAYTYLLADRDADDLPAILTASRTSLRAAKQANTLVRAFGIKRELIIGSELTVNEKGKYHILTFKLGPQLSPDDMARYAAMSQALGGVVLSADVGEENGSQEEEQNLPF